MRVISNLGRRTPGRWRWLGSGLLGVLLFLVAIESLPAQAQPCTSDSQCHDFGRTRTSCSGNTLVTRRSQCIGSCRTVEVSRQACPGPCVGDRCIGGPLVRQPGGPPLGGGGLVSPACGQICSCNGKQLTYGVGYAKSADECRRRSVDCVYGCTCDPEPRCLKRGEV